MMRHISAVPFEVSEDARFLMPRLKHFCADADGILMIAPPPFAK